MNHLFPIITGLLVQLVFSSVICLVFSFRCKEPPHDKTPQLPMNSIVRGSRR